MTRVDEDDFNYTVMSRLKTKNGLPYIDDHTFLESFTSEAEALHYAKQRAKSGYWVDVYKELYYDTGAE